MEVICLFENSGLSADEWAKHGYQVHCYDILNTERVEGNKHFHHWDANDIHQNKAIIERHKNAVMGFAFPPCTDLAVSGSSSLAFKWMADRNYREKAMNLVYISNTILSRIGCKMVIENPVSVISSEWRKPDYTFHPYEYGGYLPDDDIHPFYPEYINARDAYPKKNLLLDWRGIYYATEESCRCFTRKL